MFLNLHGHPPANILKITPPTALSAIRSLPSSPHNRSPPNALSHCKGPGVDENTLGGAPIPAAIALVERQNPSPRAPHCSPVKNRRETSPEDLDLTTFQRDLAWFVWRSCPGDFYPGPERGPRPRDSPRLSRRHPGGLIFNPPPPLTQRLFRPTVLVQRYTWQSACSIE